MRDISPKSGVAASAYPSRPKRGQSRKLSWAVYALLPVESSPEVVSSYGLQASRRASHVEDRESGNVLDLLAQRDKHRDHLVIADGLGARLFQDDGAHLSLLLARDGQVLLQFLAELVAIVQSKTDGLHLLSVDTLRLYDASGGEQVMS